MQQLKFMLSRLKNPSVVLSIVSQTIILICFYKAYTNDNIIIKVFIGICFIFAILGVLSNSCAKKIGYGDDILICENCNKNTRHILTKDGFICAKCGYKFKKEE